MPVVGGINVSVDPRIELVQTVMFLTGLQEKTRQTVLQYEYTQAVATWFAPAKNHPAVTMAAQMIKDGFIHGKPNRLVLLLGDPPHLRELYPIEKYSDVAGPGNHYGNVDALVEWVGHLRSFAVDAGFADFCTKFKAFYTSVEEHLCSVLRPSVVGELQDYFGDALGNYWLIGCPLYGNNGIQVPVPSARSGYVIAEVPYGHHPGDTPRWDSAEQLTFCLRHEYGHCFVNHLTYEHMQRINQLSALKQLHSSNWYNWWPAVINETIIRAFQARFLYLYPSDGFPELGPGWDQEPHETDLQRNERAGFHLVRGMFALLQQYENNRADYPTFRDFCPVLLEWLEAKEQEVA